MEKAAGQRLEVGKELQVSEDTDGSLKPGIAHECKTVDGNWQELPGTQDSPFPPGSPLSGELPGLEGARCCLQAANEIQGLPTQRSSGIFRLF
jgi:hypothetical protein